MRGGGEGEEGERSSVSVSVSSQLVIVVYRFDVWRETAVNAEKLVVDDSRKRQRVKRVHDFVVHLQVVLELAWQASAHTKQPHERQQMRTQTRGGRARKGPAETPGTRLHHPGVHSSLKLKKAVSWRHSWLPRSMKKRLG